MRNLYIQEVSEVSGGELNCKVTLGVPTSVSCEGSESDWSTAGKKVYAFLAVSPFTIPGIIERLT